MLLLASLYATYCAGCHGALASSDKLGATAAQTQTGISSVSGMASLSTLTTAQIQAIAAALAPAPATTTTTPPPTTTTTTTTPTTTTPPPTTTTTTTTPTTPDGAALYATYCASCHGALANSDKRKASVAQIQTGSIRRCGSARPLARTTGVSH